MFISSNERLERKIFTTLDRTLNCPSLECLVEAMDQVTFPAPISASAIALDANVFLKLGSHKRADDIVDYLSSQHKGPLILPGQAVQEFWNNQLNAVDTMYSSVKKKFDAFEAELKKMDPADFPIVSEIRQSLERFEDEYGNLYSEGTRRQTAKILGILKSRAIVPYASRTKFHAMANQRKATRTPPGFEDKGDGDFYIWVDFLFGLLQARSERKAFAKAIFVSDDQKVDWVRDGVAHPILMAEARALLGVPFQILSLKQFVSAIDIELQDPLDGEVDGVVTAPDVDAELPAN